MIKAALRAALRSASSLAALAAGRSSHFEYRVPCASSRWRLRIIPMEAFPNRIMRILCRFQRIRGQGQRPAPALDKGIVVPYLVEWR
jgi:hypothetical protein